jgi:hypothetical protein
MPVAAAGRVTRCVIVVNGGRCGRACGAGDCRTGHPLQYTLPQPASLVCCLLLLQADVSGNQEAARGSTEAAHASPALPAGFMPEQQAEAGCSGEAGGEGGSGDAGQVLAAAAASQAQLPGHAPMQQAEAEGKTQPERSSSGFTPEFKRARTAGTHPSPDPGQQAATASQPAAASPCLAASGASQLQHAAEQAAGGNLQLNTAVKQQRFLQMMDSCSTASQQGMASMATPGSPAQLPGHAPVQQDGAGGSGAAGQVPVAAAASPAAATSQETATSHQQTLRQPAVSQQ